MKTKKVLMLLCFISTIFIVGCEKDDEQDRDEDNSIKELLVSHPWKIEKQIIDGKETTTFSSEEDAYVLLFEQNGNLKSANFYSVEEEEWDIEKGLLVIDDELINIKTINSNQLVVSFIEEGTTYELHFSADEPIDSFPQKAILGKTFKSKNIYVNDELIEEEKGGLKILIEEECITATDETLAYFNWEMLTGSFIYLESRGIEGCFDIKVDDKGEITLTRYFKQFNSNTVSKETLIFCECNIWDYIHGPNWVLQEIEKNDVTIENNLPIPLGTTWYFDNINNKIEEKIPSENDINYMPWNFIEPVNDENVKINIVIDDNENQTFSMMKGNIAELELETYIDTDKYLLKFAIEKE